MRKYLNYFYIAYLNNTLVYNNNNEKYEIYIKKVLKKFRHANLYLNVKKCEFNIKKVKYLKLIILIERIEINLSKVKTINE